MDGDQGALINKPSSATKGRCIPIQEAMGLGGKDELYVSIQVSMLSTSLNKWHSPSSALHSRSYHSATLEVCTL